MESQHNSLTVTSNRTRAAGVRLRFTKMHGLGNDFMVIDLVTQRAQLLPAQIRAWADRHTGIGFDQLLTLEPPTHPESDFRYRIFNADGAEVEQCGNGARCMGRFINEQQLSRKALLTLETNSGRIRVTLGDDDSVEVDMGTPVLIPASVPFDVSHARQIDAVRYALQTSQGEVVITPVNVGNPHAVVFVADVQGAPVTTLGAELEVHPAFPARVNVGFCQVIDASFARLRVFERGVGETRACGSGACAAAVAGQVTGQLGPFSKIALTGGKLHLAWPGQGHAITMTGPASSVYEGRLDA